MQICGPAARLSGASDREGMTAYSPSARWRRFNRQPNSSVDRFLPLAYSKVTSVRRGSCIKTGHCPETSRDANGPNRYYRLKVLLNVAEHIDSTLCSAEAPRVRKVDGLLSCQGPSTRVARPFCYVGPQGEKSVTINRRPTLLPEREYFSLA